MSEPKMDEEELADLSCKLHCDTYPSCDCDAIEICVPRFEAVVVQRQRVSATQDLVDTLRARDAEERLRGRPVNLRGNVHLIGTKPNGQVLIMSPPTGLSKEAALEFAAWVVAIAMPDDGEFERVLDAVRNT